MQTLHLRAARYSLYVLFPCLALHFLNEHVIGGDTPCLLYNLDYGINPWSLLLYVRESPWRPTDGELLFSLKCLTRSPAGLHNY